jgi:hypothetical protein
MQGEVAILNIILNICYTTAETRMEPMDTSAILGASTTSDQDEKPTPLHFEVVSTIPRGEPMISGALGGFTISAPTSTSIPTFAQVPPPSSAVLAVKSNPTYSIEFPASDNSAGFTLSDFLAQLEDYTPTVRPFRSIALSSVQLFYYYFATYEHCYVVTA